MWFGTSRSSASGPPRPTALRSERRAVWGLGPRGWVGSNVNVAGWLKGQRRHADPWLGLTVAWAGMGGLLAIPQAWLLAAVADEAIFRGAGLADLHTPLALLLAVFAARAVLTWLAERAAVRAAAGVRLAVRARLFRHVQGLGPAWLVGERSGALVETLVKGSRTSLPTTPVSSRLRRLAHLWQPQRHLSFISICYSVRGSMLGTTFEELSVAGRMNRSARRHD